MRIGLIQMRCEKGAIAANLAAMEAEIRRGEQLAADLVLFPEMSITGYVDPTRDAHAVLALDGPEVARFAELTRGVRPVALAGFIERNRAGKPFITQVVARDGEVVAHYRKRTIVDKEVEWFAPGRDVAVFRQGGVGCGIAVCADIEDPAVFREAFEQGADLVLHAAAPGLHGEQATRDWQGGYDWWEGLCNYRLGDYARELGCWIAVATQAGRTADEDFPGGGFLFDPSGRRVYSTRDWNPCAVYLDVDLERQSVAVLLEQCDGS